MAADGKDAVEAETSAIQAVHLLVKRAQAVIGAAEQHLIMHPDVPRENKEFTREVVLKLWLTTARLQRDANLEADRLNLYDLFFLALCYVRAQQDPKRLKALMPGKQNLQVLLSNVQKMSVDLQCASFQTDAHDNEALDPEDMFDRCAAVVVYVYSQGIDAVLDSVFAYVKTDAQVELEQKKAEFDILLESLDVTDSSTTPMDTKSDSEVLLGLMDTKQNTGQMTEDERMVAEMRKAEQQEIDANQASIAAAKIVSDFIPVCANTFLNIWLQQSVMSEFKVATDIKDMGYDKPENMGASKDDNKRFEAWWQVSLVDPTAGFNRLWRDIAYRLWTSPGMTLFSRRSMLAAEEVLPPMSLLQLQYQNERKKSEDLVKASLVRPQDVLKLYKEGTTRQTMLPFLRLAMFVYQFQQQVNKAIVFMDTYMVLPDRLVEMQSKLEATTNEHGRVRLPLIILLVGKWYILDKRRLLLCTDVISALLTWTRIVMLDKRFAGSTEDGYSIFAWFKQLCLPAVRD